MIQSSPRGCDLVDVQIQKIIAFIIQNNHCRIRFHRKYSQELDENLITRWKTHFLRAKSFKNWGYANNHIFPSVFQGQPLLARPQQQDLQPLQVRHFPHHILLWISRGKWLMKSWTFFSMNVKKSESDSEDRTWYQIICVTDGFIGSWSHWCSDPKDYSIHHPEQPLQNQVS